jgi:hypothetical protein
VELAQRTVGDLAERRVLVIGPGRQPSSSRGRWSRAGSPPSSSPTGAMTVRSASRSASAAGPVRFDELPAQLEAADIVVSATNSPHHIDRARRARAGDAEPRRQAAAADRPRRAARHRPGLPRDRRGQPPRRRRRAADRRRNAAAARRRRAGASDPRRRARALRALARLAEVVPTIAALRERATRSSPRCWPRTQTAGRASPRPTASGWRRWPARSQPPPARADPADQARAGREDAYLYVSACASSSARRRTAPEAGRRRGDAPAPQGSPTRLRRLALGLATAAAPWRSPRPSTSPALGGAELVERPRTAASGTSRASSAGSSGAARRRGGHRRPLGQGPARGAARGLGIAGVPAREDPADAWIGPGASLGECPEGARSAPRACAAARSSWRRADLRVGELHGNVDTRLGAASELDGIVLASAGLRRLGRQSRSRASLEPRDDPGRRTGHDRLQARADDARARCRRLATRRSRRAFRRAPRSGSRRELRHARSGARRRSRGRADRPSSGLPTAASGSATRSSATPPSGRRRRSGAAARAGAGRSCERGEGAA